MGGNSSHDMVNVIISPKSFKICVNLFFFFVPDKSDTETFGKLLNVNVN